MSGENPTPIQGDLFNQFDAEAAAAAERVVRPEDAGTEVWGSPGHVLDLRKRSPSVEEERLARHDEAENRQLYARHEEPAAMTDETSDATEQSPGLRGPALVRLLLTKPNHNLICMENKPLNQLVFRHALEILRPRQSL